MKLLETKSKWITDNNFRLDAEFHLSNGASTLRLLKVKPEDTCELKKLTTDIYKGQIFKRCYVNNSKRGYVFLTATDMTKSDLNTGTYLSKKYTSQYKDLKLEEGWILLSRSGTLGITTYTNKNFSGLLGTDDLIRIIPNKERIKPGFLHAFLSSRYGYSLLVQSSYGGVIKHIEPHHIENIPVPIFDADFQNEIHNNICLAESLRLEANSLLKKANENLLSQLDINADDYELINSPFERDTALSFSINNSDLSLKTFRARNYSRRKQNIISKLQSYNYDKLGDLLVTSPFYGSRFKRITVSSENGIELLSQGDIFLKKPKGRVVSKRYINNLEGELVRKGTTLIPAQGTLGENEIFGRAKFVWGYLENKLVAGHAMRFVPNENKIPAGYLNAVLSSSLWLRILRSTVYGTNLLGFITDLLINYPIPRLTKAHEDLIDSQVKKAYECFTEANQLEDLAISKIEKALESWQK